MANPPPAELSLLRGTIHAHRVIRFWWHGKEVETEPHALLQAKRSGAFVLAGWSKSRGWEFYRFADIRGLVVTEFEFVRRKDVPEVVPLRKSEKLGK